MVRAILEGRKTQTRRIIKPQPVNDGRPVQIYWKGGKSWNGEMFQNVTPRYGEVRGHQVEFYRLWVRETWSHDGPDLETVRSRKEDMLAGGVTYGPYYRATEVAPDTLRWIPSIHMPRWASRITLEVTGVRVERLMDISEDDARAEGVEAGPCYCIPYRRLWEQINGAGSWSANPWVWVVSFSTPRGDGGGR
jgi:hypothetical protein